MDGKGIHLKVKFDSYPHIYVASLVAPLARDSPPQGLHGHSRRSEVLPRPHAGRGSGSGSTSSGGIVPYKAVCSQVHLKD